MVVCGDEGKVEGLGEALMGGGGVLARVAKL